MKIYVILVLISLVACDTSIRTSPQAGNPEYSNEIEARITRVTNNLQVRTAVDDTYESKSLSDQMAYYHTPGVSIAVINEGQIEWVRGFGKRDIESDAPVGIETLFEAGSVSKPVFALTVMRLKEKGLLDLDTDVNEYLTSWKVPKAGEWQPKITLRQILSHTAGLTVHGFPGYRPSEPVPTVPQVLNGMYPSNTPPVKVNILPGSTFRYSGGGTTIAQLVIGDLVNKPFPLIIKQELFDPLLLPYSTYQQPLPVELQNMASTAYPYKSQPINGKYHTYPEMAAAGLWSNPSEVATILIEVQSALQGNSDVFKKETIEEMLTPQKVADHIGLAFFLNGTGDSLYFEHGGWDEGFVTQITAYKHHGLGAVIMINSNEGYPLINEIMNAIGTEYEWPGYLPVQSESSAPEQDEITSLTGVYINDQKDRLSIESSGGSVYLIFGNQDPIELSKTSGGDYVNDHLNFKLTLKDDNLQLNQNNRAIQYQRQKKTKTK